MNEIPVKKISRNETVYLLIGLFLFGIAVFLARASLFPLLTFYFRAGNYQALIFFMALSTGIVLLLTYLIEWFLRAETKR